jgi:hypothetical protein
VPLLTDLRELKAVLEIDPDDTSEDLKLNFCMEWSTQWIEELLNRPGIFKKERTEYYSGTGTQKLLLRSRPVFTTPTILVYEDDGAFYGSVTGSFDSDTSALTYGVDFCLEIDQEDGTSRSGILVRMKDYWGLPGVRQQGFLTPFLGEAFGNIKIVYTAGHSIDNLPSTLRMACNLLAAKIRYVLPLGLELSSESYLDRSVSLLANRRDYLLSLVKPLILPFRNWKW